LLESFGIPTVSIVLTCSAEQAVAAAEKMGYPVALKIESRSIAHKSDIGGVALRLSNGAQVRDAFTRVSTEASARSPDARIEGVVVQRMAGEGVEMILGVKRDPLFGPVVLCGMGGILVEVLKDVVIGIPPISNEQARDMIERLRGFAVLGGARGKPPADIDALSAALAAVSRLAATLKDRLAGLDINPLIVLPKGEGVVAVDALVELQ
jgi:succinyl-CoA synthetase beta subunit